MSDVVPFVPKPRQLREIDGDLLRARRVRSAAVQELGRLLVEVAQLESEIVDLDVSFDAMLEVREDVRRRLAGVPGA